MKAIIIQSMVFSGSFRRFEMSQLHKLFFRFPVVSFSFSLDAFFFLKGRRVEFGPGLGGADGCGSGHHDRLQHRCLVEQEIFGMVFS